MDIGSKIIDERYAILEKLGQGAFGEVFKAQDHVGGVTVAIKTIPDEVSRDASELADLKQNFQLVTKLNHPHIANYKNLEHCKETDKHLLIMEYVEGMSLAQFRKAKPDRKVSVEEAIKICRQIADALDYAHKQSILHRDIKPGNVHITASGNVKLLDFGLASEIRSTLLKLSHTIGASANAGTRPYMSPELFLGQPPGPGVDMYALGVLFHELISGNLPFQSDDVQVLMNAVCSVPPKPMKELSKAQNIVLLKMLAKDPDARFSSAGAFVSALEQTLSLPSKTPKVLAALAGLALAGGVGWYVMKPPPIPPVERVTASLFQQMLRKNAATFRDGIGLIASFSGCSPLVYKQSKTALIRSANAQGWDILVRKDLQAIVDDQGMVRYFKTGQTDKTPIKLSEVESSQAVVVGECEGDELHLRVIDTNSVALAAASGLFVDQDKVAQAAEEQQEKDHAEAERLAEQEAVRREEARLAEIKRKRQAEEAHQVRLAQRQQADDAVQRQTEKLAALKREREAEEARLAILKQEEAARQQAARLAAAERARDAEEARLVQLRQEEAARKQAELAQAGYGLTVHATPPDATIRILNIAPRYRPGMILKPGEYHVEVSKAGYKRVRQWVKVASQDLRVTIVLPSQPVDAKRWTDPTTGMVFVKIPGGCFQMGSTSGESNEKPVHKECVDDFWMGQYEVTNAQYRKFKSDHSSKEYEGHALDGATQPVVYVSWDDAKTFSEWLSRQGNGTFHLPTEAEWEYAARAGTKTKRYWGDGEREACQYANVFNPSTKQAFGWSWGAFPCEDGFKVTSPVGKFRANKFGLYDMMGNVWEWTCSDWGGYGDGKKNHAKCSSGGSYRVSRGGSWDNKPANVRSANRNRYDPGGRSSYLGFRVSRTYR